MVRASASDPGSGCYLNFLAFDPFWLGWIPGESIPAINSCLIFVNKKSICLRLVLCDIVGATRHLVKSSIDNDDSERPFVDPLIDARKGKWRSSAGRLGRNVTGAEIDEFGNPYLT